MTGLTVKGSALPTSWNLAVDSTKFSFLNTTQSLFASQGNHHEQFHDPRHVFSDELDRHRLRVAYKKMFEKVKEKLNKETLKVDAKSKKNGQAVPPNPNSTLNSDTPQVQ